MMIRTSILILAWLVLGYSTFADQLDSGDFGRAPLVIAIPDSNDDIDDAESCEIETAGFTSSAGLTQYAIQGVRQPLNTSSRPRYQLIRVYRL